MEDFSNTTDSLENLFNLSIDQIDVNGANGIILDLFYAVQSISNENFSKINAELLKLELDGADAQNLQTIRSELQAVQVLLSISQKKASSMASEYDNAMKSVLSAIRDALNESEEI